MFDITSSKLLILGIVALLVIGPKDLPALLRTVGKYMGMIKRQAAEFRAQFDEAMRESELAELKKSVETLQRETETSVREATSSVEKQLSDASESVTAAMEEPKPAADPMANYLDGPPAAHAPADLNGAPHASESTTIAASGGVGTPAAPKPEDQGRATEKSGA